MGGLFEVVSKNSCVTDLVLRTYYIHILHKPRGNGSLDRDGFSKVLFIILKTYSSAPSLKWTFLR